MSVLVIGGNGLLGPVLTQKLHAQGEEVVSFSSRQPAAAIEGVHYELGDVCEYGTINRIIKKYKVDRVIHNAAISSPKFYADNPHKVFRINVQGTLAALEAAWNFEVSRFVYVSSIAVYGGTQASLVHEDLPRRGVDCYSASKIACEEIVRNYGLSTVALRLGFVYGPGRVITCPIREMVCEIVKSGAVHWPGGRDQTQDYIYVEDAAEGILAAMRAQNCTRAEYNMATGEAVPFTCIMEKVQSFYPEASIDIGPGDFGFRPGGKLHMEDAFRDLDWKPRYSIEEGLERYIPWIDAQVRKDGAR